jgi:hypothetical protein
MQPFRQSGKTLFAGNGTNTWLLWRFAATECAVPRGAGADDGVLNVGTTCTRVCVDARGERATSEVRDETLDHRVPDRRGGLEERLAVDVDEMQAGGQGTG